MQSQRRNASRILLVAFTLWGLAMIVPDLYRWDRPLGSFGFYANNDGLITDVQGPFPNEAASPAFAAGLRRGDRLDLTQMRCIPINTLTCSSTMAALGGMRLVGDRQRPERERHKENATCVASLALHAAVNPVVCRWKPTFWFDIQRSNLRSCPFYRSSGVTCSHCF
jgi:hypothetical protein